MKEIKRLIADLLRLNHTSRLEFNTKMKAQEALMLQLKELAKAENTLIGRIIKFQCADSYAYYVISKLNKTTAVILWVNYCDGWKDDMAGDRALIDLRFANHKVSQENQLDTLKTILDTHNNL